MGLLWLWGQPTGENLLLLPLQVQQTQQDDLADTTTIDFIPRTLTSLYSGLFSREGFLKCWPIFPGAKLPAEGIQDKTQLLYFAMYDAVNKTLGFLGMQSASSTAGYYLVEQWAKPPGQIIDLRYILVRDAHTDFSAFLQLHNFSRTSSLSAIFWILLVPMVLRLALGVFYLAVNEPTKQRTAGEYAQANSWRECIGLYGKQAVEILMSNLLVNIIMLCTGSSLSAALANPQTINGMKVALALSLWYMECCTKTNRKKFRKMLRPSI